MARLWTKVVLFLLVAFLLAPANSFAGDAYLKLGLRFSPDPGSFSNAWFFSGGSDWGFHPQGFWGLEFQGAYHSETVEGIKVSAVPANVFFNLKWKADTEGVRPYVGGGIGLVSSYVKISAGGESEHEWIKDAGFQLMGGVEFNRKFAVELMGQKVFEEDTSWLWSVLFGIRF